MQNYGDHTSRKNGVVQPRKRLGGYLVEAGLLTPAQVTVALNDQRLTGMRFGEVLATRGWVKQQTIEYFMQKVVLPEREGSESTSTPRRDDNGKEGKSGAVVTPMTPRSQEAASAAAREAAQNKLHRREVPISKPLPSVKTSEDGDVSWVG